MSFRYEKEAIKRFGNTYIINKNHSDEWLFPCKLCNKPNDSNLHVNVRTGLYNCFHNCSNHGHLSKIYSLSNIKEDFIGSGAEKTKQKKQIIYYIFYDKKPLTKEQKLALYKRGLSDEDISYYNISGGSRIQIPNYVIGELTDFICKWEWRKDKITKTNPKYLNDNRGTQKSNILFNLHNIPQKADSIIICEGIFNAIPAGRNAVASYGCEISEQQLDLLVNHNPQSIVIAYDSDLPGVKGSLRIIKFLRSFGYKGKVYYVLLPKGIDINDMGREKFLSYLGKNRMAIQLDSKMSWLTPKLLYEAKNI